MRRPGRNAGRLCLLLCGARARRGEAHKEIILYHYRMRVLACATLPFRAPAAAVWRVMRSRARRCSSRDVREALRHA